jgi:membrane protease YdiL (CAAX protease family)
MVGDRILSCSPVNDHLCEAKLRMSPVVKCLIVFALAFAVRQATVAFFSNTPYETGVRSLASFGILLIPVLALRFGDGGFRERGFVMPKRVNRLFSISLFLAFVYVFVVIFVPGSVAGFEAAPGVPISWGLLFSAGSIVLAVVAAEAVFRGYVQAGVEKAFGWYVSFAVVSVLFTLYMLPVSVYFTEDAGEVVRLALPLLAESLFLCFFLRETKTLLCPVVFAATASLLVAFTPLEASAVEYTMLVSLVCYVFLVPVMQMFVAEVKGQDARAEVVLDLDSEDQVDANVRSG